VRRNKLKTLLIVPAFTLAFGCNSTNFRSSAFQDSSTISDMTVKQISELQCSQAIDVSSKEVESFENLTLSFFGYYYTPTIPSLGGMFGAFFEALGGQGAPQVGVSRSQLVNELSELRMAGPNLATLLKKACEDSRIDSDLPGSFWAAADLMAEDAKVGGPLFPGVTEEIDKKFSNGPVVGGAMTMRQAAGPEFQLPEVTRDCTELTRQFAKDPVVRRRMIYWTAGRARAMYSAAKKVNNVGTEPSREANPNNQRTAEDFLIGDIKLRDVVRIYLGACGNQAIIMNQEVTVSNIQEIDIYLTQWVTTGTGLPPPLAFIPAGLIVENGGSKSNE
jgi:hypothetical protein